MKIIAFILAFVCGITLSSPLARAQETTGRRVAERQAMHDRLVLKVEEAKLAKIKAELGLDDASAKQFFAIYKVAEKEIQAIVRDRNEALRKLALLTNDTKTDAEVDALMQKILDLKKQIADRGQKLDNDLKPILTPRQRAKLLVFEHQFNERLREQLARGGSRTRNANLRELRRLERERRLKNRLLRKQAAEKAAEGH
jgi:Spy/CpxP family protein refolding chaperone